MSSIDEGDWSTSSFPPAHYSTIIGEMPPTIGDSWSPITVANAGESIAEARLDSLRETLARELDVISHYPRGWDGYDGLEFDPNLVKTVSGIADRVVREFRSADAIPLELETGPASDGSIDIECGVGGRSMLLTFYPREAQLELSLTDKRDEWDTRERVEAPRLASWVSWLLGESLPPAPLDNPA